MDPVIAKYAEARLPRYTSYPTAPHFGPEVGGATMAAWLGALDPELPLSLYLHVPFCRQVCWYCACNMKLAAREGPVEAYAETLLREIDLVADALPRPMAVTNIHWGGGTPTAMPLVHLGRITRALRERFEVLGGAEIAYELDPRTFTPEMAPGLAALGASRVSLGVQEFDARVQAAVNRVQPFEQVAATVERIRAAGIDAINFDLMYGLPYQSEETIARTVDQVVALGPDRIALFGYAHVPWMAKNQRMIPEDALPGSAARFAQAEAAAEMLVRQGYVRIGLDHFARPGDAMAAAMAAGTLKRNFQGYTVDEAEALIGIGATSISALPQGYVQNIPEERAHGRAVAAGVLPAARGRAVSAEDMLRRAVIERLMCEMEVDLAEIARAHGRPTDHFAGEHADLADLEADGLIERRGWRLLVRERGRAALRVVAARFDTYLSPEAGPQRHAVAV